MMYWYYESEWYKRDDNSVIEKVIVSIYSNGNRIIIVTAEL